MANRLADATSPYLLQHADNPVDWWPWCDEAFIEARRRDVPIILSVGYAACHWCHVMAHDSFENDDIAALMNDNFVSIKVDREERPDIDAVYMAATTALTGQGGWPMTCILTPTGEPFFAGTFFPRAHFARLLAAVTEAWNTERAEVLAAGNRIATALAQQSSMSADGVPLPTKDHLDEAARTLAKEFDAINGGFGGAPKFPPSMVLEFLLRNYERTNETQLLSMVEKTCNAMARGGMYDQLSGGFARYSVDEQWVVPHFEKMLYDNAQLIRVYVHLLRLTGSELAGRIVREAADFLLRDLRTQERGFASALDADTDGVEGLTYVWTPQQLHDILGDQADRAASLLAVTEHGTFEHGASTLQLHRDPDDQEWWTDVRARLLNARKQRPQPARDDKVVTAWNGLAIAALAEAGVMLNEREYLDAALACAEFIERVHLIDGRLRRTSREGRAGEAAGVAEDYGDLAEGLLMLHQATGEPHWLETAGTLLDAALTHFAAPDGSFFDTADDAERLVRRPKDPTDNATPSGQSALASALITYSALTGSLRHREAAEAALKVVTWLGVREPRFLGWGLAAAEALISGPVEIALVGVATELAHVAWWHRPPGAVVVSGEPDAPGVPLLADRTLVQGQPAAYVCRGMVCDAPVISADELRGQLR